MKLPMKQWFLYGTLFGVLGFTVSGHDPQTEGSAQLSQEVAPHPVPPAAPPAKTQAEAPARQSAAPVSTEVPASKPVPEQKPAAAATTTAPAPVRVQVPQRGDTAPQAQQETRVAPGRTTAQPKDGEKYENYSLYVEATGKTYQVYMYTKDGKTKVIYNDKAEGKECTSNECLRNNPMAVFEGEMAGNLDAIMKDLKYAKIPEAAHKSKKKDKESEDAEEKESAGLTVLNKKIKDRCKHLSDKAELKCKTETFIEILKSNKRKSKSADKRERLITDEDAVEYFNTNLKDYLKEMLTHKYAVIGITSLDPISRMEDMRDIYNQKREALAEKDVAKKLIRSLLREIDATYKETRKEVTSLYKSAMEEQAQEAVLNLRQMDLSRRENDFNGMRTNWGSFLENFGHLNILNNDIYGTMTDSLRSAYRAGDLGVDPMNEMLRSLQSDRSSILAEYFNSRMLNMASNPDLARPGAVTNAARQGRGTSINSGSVGSSTNSLIQNVLSNGGGRVGSGSALRGN